MENIPTYKFKLKFKGGTDNMSIVKRPAMEADFFMFSAEGLELFYEEPKRNIVGIALVPDKPILRFKKQEDGTVLKYNGIFDAEEIVNIRNDFMRSNSNTKVNFEHSENKPSDVYLVETFIVESKLQQQDLKQRFSINAPINSLIVMYHADSIETFNDIKSSGFQGFSMELYLDLVPVNNNKFNKDNMMNRIIEKFKAVLAEFEQEEDTKRVAETGQEIIIGAVGEPVEILTGDSESETKSPMPDGTYMLETGEEITVKAGMLESIVEAKEEMEDEKKEEKKEDVEELPEELPVISGDTKTEKTDEKPKVEEEELDAECIAAFVAEGMSEEEAKLKCDEAQKAEEDKVAEELKQKFSAYEATITDLKAEIVTLKAQLKLPVTEPVVNQKQKTEFSKAEFAAMTPYQRIAVSKGFRVIK